MESKVAERFRTLKLACEHQPIYGQRKNLSDYYDEQLASDDLRYEMLRVSSNHEVVPRGIVDDANAMFNQVKSRLLMIGSYFESRCYYNVFLREGRYHVVIDFPGWPTILSCGAEDETGTVIFGVKPFKIAFDENGLSSAITALDGAIDPVILGIREPTIMKLMHAEESLQWPTAVSPSITRFVWCDVPELGRLINRYHRFGENHTGPWQQVEYPGGVMTLVSQLPHNRAVPLSHDNGTPTKE